MRDQTHKELRELYMLVRTCKLSNMSDTDIARAIIRKYGLYLTQITYEEYIAWLRSDRRFTRIYFEVVAKEAYAEIKELGGVDIY